MMEEEIKSQSDILQNIVNTYVMNYCVLIDIPLQIKRIVIVASGSSYNAGLYGKYFFENIAKVETSVEYASEFANSEFDNYNKDALYVFLSQSGNSSDVINSIRKVTAKSIKTLCITNNIESILFQISDYKFCTNAQEEKAIAATKTFTSCVLMLWLISLKIAQNNRLDISQETRNINFIGQNIKDTLTDTINTDLAINLISKQKDFSIAAQGHNYPLAKEAALKIKEINYINTNAYPLGEFVHGHFAILNKSKLFLTILTGEISQSERELLHKILKTYKTTSIIITDRFDDFDCDVLVKYPPGQSRISNIICSIVLIQMLTLGIAKKLKRNPDKPNGLNKVVKNKEIF